MNKLSVRLRVYYGDINYDVKGNVKSKNEALSMIFESPEWENFLKHVQSNGVSKIEVLEAYDLSKVNEKIPVSELGRYEKVEDLSKIKTNVAKYFSKPEKELTPEQIQIKELQEKIEVLTANSVKPLIAVHTNNTTNDLKLARDEYEKVVGKKSGPTWTIEQINQKINDFKALEAVRATYLEVVGEKADDTLTLDELNIKITETQGK